MRLLHRLFFALVPSPRERARIGLLRDDIVGSRGLVSNDRLHLTLGITDDFDSFPDTIAQRMLAIGASVAADPFTLTLDRISAGMHSVALRPSHRSSRLTDLQHQLGTALARWNVARQGWAFSPHVTLAYRDGQPFLRPIAPVSVEANDFVLLHSEVGVTRHHELARWPLSVRQQCFLLV